jgi:hypothetical protein
MHTRALFLTRAKECESMAKITRDRASKETWRRMAARWQRCAQIEAKAITTSHRDSDAKRARAWSSPGQRSSRWPRRSA